MDQFDGPIPGENFTSDTKNYPWHRPPQHTELDDAIEDAYKTLLEKNASVSIITPLELAVPAVQIADMFCTSGIGKAKWTVDFALLMAGPVTHIIYLMGKSYGVSVDLGIDDGFKAPTTAFFKEVKQVDRIKAVKSALGIPIEQIKSLAGDQDAPKDVSKDSSSMPPKSSGGFMGEKPAAAEEQSSFMNSMGG